MIGDGERISRRMSERVVFGQREQEKLREANPNALSSLPSKGTLR